MKRNNSKNFLVLLLIVLIVFFFFAYAYKNKRDSETNNVSYSQYYEYNGKQYIQNDDLSLILFAGLDSYDNNIVDSYRNNELSDCLVLLVLDRVNETVLPIQINRDTMCSYNILGIGGQITGEAYGQIALAHSYGSGDLDSLINSKDAVSKLLTDIYIDTYISLPMNAISILNDKADGVNVYIQDDFSGIDDTLVQGTTVLLKGSHALTFVRARSGMDDSSNIARMERQRVYLRALFDKCSNLVNNDSSFSQDALIAVGDYLIANTDTYGLSDIMNELLSYELLDAVKLEGTAKKGDMFIEFYPDEDKLEEFCINTFYTEVK